MNLTVREVLDRYGPAIAVMAVLVLLVALVPGNAEEGQTVSAAESGVSDPGATGFDGSSVGSAADGASATAGTDAVTTAPSPGRDGASASGGSATATGGEGGVTGGSADPAAPPPGEPAGGGGAAGQGEAAQAAGCREDGRMDAFSPVAPPCVPVFTGDNGGATSPGVTGDTITVVRYFSKSSAATQATLQAIGAADPRPQQIERGNVLTRYFNTHYETYGRAVELVVFESNADSDDEAALRADAVKIANEIGPFAVIGAGSVTAAELAARGIVCICTTSLGSGYYQQHSPYIFQVWPELEEFYQHLAEYIGKRLAGKPAEHAGTNVGLDTSARSFGLIYMEGTGNRIDPRAKEARVYFEQQLAQYGVELTRVVAYTYDAAQGQSQATNIMAQMKAEGVTTVACICDPIYPIFFTKAATQQQYFPEWLITGTFLSDTTFFGRTYDQQQWSNAFGISPLPVPATDLRDTHPYKEFHHVAPEAQDGDEGTQILVDEPAYSLFFSGLHFAGPDLTPETFARGLWDAPASGGTHYVTVKYTRESFAAIKDFSEVFWDPSGTGEDEVGNQGAGIMLRTGNGARYLAGEWPSGDPEVFDRTGTVYTNDDPPVHDHDADGHTHPPEERCRSCR